MNKIAVVLFNLGGPDSRDSIRPFLMNFFTDPNIIRVPGFLRRFIAARIADRRAGNEAGDSYALLGNKSPLLENTLAQAAALEEKLNAGGDHKSYKVFVSMRYWHPMAPEAAQAVKAWDPHHIVLLPLYPQFSTTTTRSSFQSWDAACDDIDLLLPTSTVCCYPLEDGFIDASALNVKAVYDRALAETGKTPRILFSAHGLPEKVIDDGDPYQWQCEQTARAIAERTGIADPDWQICYQSRVGPMKWIGPSTEEAIRQAAEDGVPVVILPHAFTQEHVETLVEIEIEYRHLADEIGLDGFYRVPVVSVHPDFIDGLAGMVRRLGYQTWTSSETGRRMCPQGYRRCCMV